MKDSGRRGVSAHRWGFSQRSSGKATGASSSKVRTSLQRGEAPPARSPVGFSGPGPYDSSDFSPASLFQSRTFPFWFLPPQYRHRSRLSPAPARVAKVTNTGYPRERRHHHCSGNVSLLRVPLPRGVQTPSFPCIPGS